MVLEMWPSSCGHTCAKGATPWDGPGCHPGQDHTWWRQARSNICSPSSSLAISPYGSHLPENLLLGAEDSWEQHLCVLLGKGQDPGTRWGPTYRKQLGQMHAGLAQP